jgi:MFS transporter, DHA1 family, multidrug resistance protein
MKTSNKTLILLIIIFSPLMSLPLDIYAPSLPAIADYFFVSYLSVKISLLAFWVGFGVGQPLTGLFIDRSPRRRMLIISFSVLVVSALLATLMHSVNAMIIMRVLQGMACACIAAAIKAVMMDSFEGHDLAKVTNYYSLGWSLTPIFAPFIGGYLQFYIGWQASFIFIAVYALLAVVLCLLLLKETMHTSFKQSIPEWLTNCKTVLTNTYFLVILSFLIAECSVLAVFYTASPFLIQDVLGFTSARYGHVMLLLGLSYFVGSLINRLCLQWFSANALIGVGLIASLLISLVMLFLASLDLNPLVLVVPMIFLFIADGLVFSNAMSACFNYFTKLSNVASSLMGGFLSLGGALVALLVGCMSVTSMWPLAIAYTVIFCIVLPLYFFVFRRG